MTRSETQATEIEDIDQAIQSIDDIFKNAAIYRSDISLIWPPLSQEFLEKYSQVAQRPLYQAMHTVLKSERAIDLIFHIRSQDDLEKMMPLEFHQRLAWGVDEDGKQTLFKNLRILGVSNQEIKETFHPHTLAHGETYSALQISKNKIEFEATKDYKGYWTPHIFMEDLSEKQEVVKGLLREHRELMKRFYKQ